MDKMINFTFQKFLYYVNIMGSITLDISFILGLFFLLLSNG